MPGEIMFTVACIVFALGGIWVGNNAEYKNMDSSGYWATGAVSLIIGMTAGCIFFRSLFYGSILAISFVVLTDLVSAFIISIKNPLCGWCKRETLYVFWRNNGAICPSCKEQSEVNRKVKNKDK